MKRKPDFFFSLASRRLMLGGGAIARQLRARGRVVVRAPRAVAACDAAVDAWSRSGLGFRYPIPSQTAGPSCLPSADGLEALYRRAFNELYVLAAACAHQLHTHALPLPPPPDATIRPFIFDKLVGRDSHFSECPDAALGYSASFGSIFNFDRGFLNAHTDRGVLTAIYGRHRISSDSGKSNGGNQTSDRLRADSDQSLDGQVWDSTGGNQTTSLDHLRAASDPLLDGQLWDRAEALRAPCGGDITDGKRVRLWGLDPQTAAWHPLDTEGDNSDGISMGDPMIDDPNHRWDPLKEPIARDARHPPLDTSGAHSDGGGADGGGTPFVLLVAGEQLERLSGGGYRALLHACRVDPRSEPISMLHQGPHPGSEREGNRQSMALVLALDEDSKGRPVLSHRR